MSLETIGRAMGGISAGAVCHAAHKAEHAGKRRSSRVRENMERIKYKFKA